MKKMVSIGALALVAAAGTLNASTIYNSIQSPLAGSYPSLGYQATQTSELGDRVSFGGAARDLTTVSVTMVNWAKYEDYNVGGQYYDQGQWVGNGFTHDLTFNIYQPGTGTSHGSLIASITQPTFIEYRPTGWGFNGFAQNVTFDFTSLNVALPEDVVWGIAYSTQTYGASPLGINGPYNSLNVGLNPAGDGGVTVGSTDLDALFWNTSTAAWYADSGAAGAGIFREDTDWAGYNPMVQFNAVPTPGALALMGLGGLAAARRRR
jgi:hypothetical protein